MNTLTCWCHCCCGRFWIALLLRNLKSERKFGSSRLNHNQILVFSNSLFVVNTECSVSVFLCSAYYSSTVALTTYIYLHGTKIINVMSDDGVGVSEHQQQQRKTVNSARATSLYAAFLQLSSIEHFSKNSVTSKCTEISSQFYFAESPYHIILEQCYWLLNIILIGEKIFDIFRVDIVIRINR